MKINLLAGVTLLSLHFAAYAQSSPQTAAHFEALKAHPAQLNAFIQAMPKGGDLHNHASGAAYAENLIRYGLNDHLCLDPQNFVAKPNPTCSTDQLLENEIKNPDLYDAIIDAWSMRHFHTGKESGHDHFFATFGKFGFISGHHSGEILAELAKRAGKENESYLELMMTPDGNDSGQLGKTVGWDPDFDVMRTKLMANGLPSIIDEIHQSIDADEAKMHAVLQCDKEPTNIGCKVTIRYLYQVLRGQAPEMVFAQLLAGFEAANQHKKVVGINMVQPEDGPISMRDYALQMRMVGYLHKRYPDVHISLHAGELNDAVATPEGLSFHIRDAVYVAHADRIGHGVDVAGEQDADRLLRDMANQRIMVEINLSSNDLILNVTGKKHPLPLYLRYNVPVALSTDDEGVSRSNLTHEFKRAIDTYQFSYDTVKNMVRNSLAYSFLAGDALWTDVAYQQIVPACAKDKLGSATPSANCASFLQLSEKATLQWDLEARFNKFEETH